MYFKEEIDITEEDKIICEKLAELLAQSKIDDYFYTHDQDFFVQIGLFTNTEFEEAYNKGFGRYFSDKWFYRWVRGNVINKFIGLLEALFKGVLEQFKEDADGNLTYKNCIKAYRTVNVVTQSIEQEESDTHDVSSRILTLDEITAFENGTLKFEDNIIQTMPCFYIKTESADKVDSKKKKELIQEIRVLVFKRLCALLEKNFKRANCVEILQYRLMLGLLTGVIDASFEPRLKKEQDYDSYEVAKGKTVNLESEYKYFRQQYVDFKHYKKSLIKL